MSLNIIPKQNYKKISKPSFVYFNVRNFWSFSRFCVFSLKFIPVKLCLLANHEYLFIYSDFYSIEPKSHIKKGSTAKVYYRQILKCCFAVCGLFHAICRLFQSSLKELSVLSIMYSSYHCKCEISMLVIFLLGPLLPPPPPTTLTFE